jgi:hypothetical protein
MHLHVLTGCRDLLKPDILTPEATADLIGPEVRLPHAYWISPKSGNRYHDYLQEKSGDRRTAVMAEALKDDFGSRFAPLLVLADLLDDKTHDDQRESHDSAVNHRSQLTVLSEILACGQVRSLELHALALSSKVDPDSFWTEPAGIVPGNVWERVEELRSAVSEHIDSAAVTTHVTEVTPDLTVFNKLYSNALSNHFARRLKPRLLECGWAPESEGLSAAISEILSRLTRRGVYPGLPLGSDHLAGMADLVFKRLLQE